MSILKSQEDSEFNHSKEEVDTLNTRISDLSQVLHARVVTPSEKYSV